MMNFEDCFRLLHERLQTELIVTSAGNCSELWWEISRETERVFYLDASMSMASLLAAGIAYGNPEKTVVAFSGDGAFNMNPGMLFAERDLDHRRGSILIRNGKGGRRREVGMDEWGWEQLQPG